MINMERSQATELWRTTLQVEEESSWEFADESKLPYQHIKNLGFGRGGSVEKILNTETQLFYARKTFRLPRRTSERKRVREYFIQELKNTRSLENHRHMVKVVESYYSKDGPVIILEPAADGGSLDLFLEGYKKASGEARASMQHALYQAYGCLANGLNFMHQKNIRHRDIKPENILVHSGSVLFADFGISRDYSDKDRATTEGTPDFRTLRYCAPEVRWGEERSWKSDVFSLGCVFLLIYTAMLPNAVVEDIAATSNFYENLEQVEKEMKGFEQDVDVVDCMRGMLQYDMRRRPEAVDIVWFLMRDRRKYLCQQCRKESAAIIRPTDLAASLSLSRSNTVCEDDASIIPLSISTNLHTDSSNSKIDEPGTEEVTFSMTPEKDIQEEFYNIPQPITPMLFEPFSTTPTLISKPPLSRRDSLISNASHGTTFTNTHLIEEDFQNSIRDKTTPIPSRLSHLGIHKYKLVRAIQPTSNPFQNTKFFERPEDRILYEEHIYQWASRYLGFGFLLRTRNTYGSILPSLTTYPVVQEFDFEWDLVQRGSIADVQRAFASRKVHPCIQNQEGTTLFDLAITFRRLDICRLLRFYGAHSNLAPTSSSLLVEAMSIAYNHSASTAIDFMRFILDSLSESLDLDHNRDDPANYVWGQQRLYFLPPEVTLWLWNNGPTYGLDPITIREFCLRCTLRGLQSYLPKQRCEALDTLRHYLTPDLVVRIKKHELVLLDDLFILSPFSLKEEDEWKHDSWALGSLWLSALSHSGVDIPAYLAHELEAHTDHVLNDFTVHFQTDVDMRRMIVCKYSDQKGHTVGWRDADDYIPGELFLDVFERMIMLSADGEWPFTEAVQMNGRIPGSWVD